MKNNGGEATISERSSEIVAERRWQPARLADICVKGEYVDPKVEEVAQKVIVRVQKIKGGRCPRCGSQTYRIHMSDCRRMARVAADLVGVSRTWAQSRVPQLIACEKDVLTD